MILPLALPLSLIIQSIGAVYLGDHVALIEDNPPRTTSAPSPDTVLYLLSSERAESTDAFYPPCASACVSSAVVDLNLCQVDDWTCNCDPTNLTAIMFNGEGCVEGACGGAAAASRVWRTFELECNTYLHPTSTKYSTTFLGTNGNTVTGSTTTDTLPLVKTTDEISRSIPSLSTVLVTTTASDGSQVTVTAVVNPTDYLPATPQPSSSASSTPDSSLSKGAVAGIAVGATIAGLALIAVLAWLLYRRHSIPSSGGAIQAEVATADTNFPDKPELPGVGKAVSVVSTTPALALAPSFPSMVASPAVAELMQSPRIIWAAELSGSEAVHRGEVQAATVPLPSSALVEMPSLEVTAPTKMAGQADRAMYELPVPSLAHDPEPQSLTGNGSRDVNLIPR